MVIVLIENRYKVVVVPTVELHPHPKNDAYKTPLDDKSEEYIMMLASIETDGIRHPLLVQLETNIVISGHTRLRIAHQLGLESVPVIYHDVNDEEAETLLVADNVERAGKERDLIRLSRAIDRLYQRYASRREANTALSGVFALQDRQLDRLRSLLRLITPLQQFISSGHIGLKAGAAIVSLSDEEQTALVKYIFESGLSTENDWKLTEKHVEEYKRRLQYGVPGESEEEQSSLVELGGTPKGTTRENTNTAKRDHAIFSGLSLLKRDIRAAERMALQTLPAIEAASEAGSSEIKKEIATLRKVLKEVLNQL